MTQPLQASTTTYDPWNPQTWPRSHYYWWMFALACMAFVWFTPKDVLDKYPQFVPFTDFMASWNLQVRRMGEISGQLNQANRFCSAVLWCVVPIAWIPAVAEMLQPNPFLTNYSRNMKNFVFLLGTLVFLYYTMWLPHSADSSKLGRLMFMNSFGRGFFIPSLIWCFGLFTIAWIRIAILWLPCLPTFLRSKVK